MDEETGCKKAKEPVYTAIPEPIGRHGPLTLGCLWGAARWPDILGEERMGTGQLVWGPGEPQQGPGCTWKTLCGISEPRRETLAKQE